MKKFFYYLSGLLLACGPGRDFEDKNIFGSQTVGSTSVSIASTSTTGDESPAWPQENIGFGIEKTIPDFVFWNGFAEGPLSSPKEVQLTTRDWYDPTGNFGINAILVITAKYQCSSCAEEAKGLNETIKSWQSQKRKIKVVTLLINSDTNGLPDITSALTWKIQYEQSLSCVGIDPQKTFASTSSFSTPLNTIIDPRTMKVIDVSEGYTKDYSKLEELENANK